MKSEGFWRGGLRRSTQVAGAILLMAGCRAYAAAEGHAAGPMDEVARVLLALVIVLIAAKLGGELFMRMGQPAVLGELVVGMALGNLYLLRVHGFEFIRFNETIEILAEIGVILLLFEVGLESDLHQMMKVGASSLVVATVGVVAPFFLGWGTATYFLPHESVYVHLFIGATLCATSVGITARVLRDLGRLQTPEARVILGAAVIDDVQGLVILAVVEGMIHAANGSGAGLSSLAILWIVFKATAFVVGALVIGRWISPRIFQAASRFKGADLLLVIALGLCFGFAYLAWLIGLAAIVGAFAAGLMLEEVHWRNFRDRGEHSVREVVRPLAAFLIPVFFVTMGARVDLLSFANTSVLAFAGVLTLAAILGKQVCGLGVLQKGLDRLSVGIGMVPRGEVGLIFAAIGSRLLMGGEPVVSPATFSAVVIMVVITTIVTPPALKWSMSRRAQRSPECSIPIVQEGSK